MCFQINHQAVFLFQLIAIDMAAHVIQIVSDASRIDVNDFTKILFLYIEILIALWESQ